MKFIFFVPMMAVFLLPAPAVPRPESFTDWAAVEVPRDREAGSVKLLESQRVPTISWSNALVEVSAFDKVETRQISTLEATLTPGDPRWDPWLKELKPVFLPGDSARIWVPTARLAEVRGLLGVESNDRGASPRRITGWLVVGFSLLYLVFRLWAEFLGPAGRKPWSRLLWLPICIVVLVGGVVMTGGATEAGHSTSAKISASWLRHLWFQEAWPYGAQWKDWAPGKPWTYRAYVRREGRIVESAAALAMPDAAWAEASYLGLDSHGAARLFPRENP